MLDKIIAPGLAALLCALLTGIGAPGVYAAEEKHERSALDELLDGEHCVSLSRIDRTEVVDDRDILFYMKGDTIYLNRLPHRCPGLKWERTFMYRTSLNQLCDLDIITVLENMGFGLRPGVSCGLGMFYPISEETARQLKAGELE